MSNEAAPDQKKRILVIDDNEIILQDDFHEVAERGVSGDHRTGRVGGVALVRREKPDLVLLDITFPPDVSGVSWDGFRIMDWLASRGRNEKNPHHRHQRRGGGEKTNRRAAASGAIAFFSQAGEFRRNDQSHPRDLGERGHGCKLRRLFPQRSGGVIGVAKPPRFLKFIFRLWKRA